MQAATFDLQQVRIGSLPIIRKYLNILGVKDLLHETLDQPDYAEALETLVMSVLLRPEALYRVGEWANAFDDGLVRKGLSDDVLGRSLDRLFKADRASLLTKLALVAIDKFKIDTSQLHNDSTSVKLTGSYEKQHAKAVQLKRGHSKDHRPDLRQLVYSLSVTRDGAIPIHFKAYDGNRTDDKTHWDLWQSLRGLLGRSDFLYVADSKLCVAETMNKIDREQGFFVTILPRTRQEVAEFTKEAAASRVRWQSVHRQPVRKSKIDHFEVVEGLFQMREGYRIYWYRSSEKKVRDKQDRESRISIAREQLLHLNNVKRRGPKTEAAMKRAIDKIVSRYKIRDWLAPTLKVEEVERFRQTRKGKATASSLFKRSTSKIVRVDVRDNLDSQTQSAAMDGISPLVTNKDLSALATLKAYKFQPNLEKRHNLLKSTLNVAPVFLKKNDRIEALMFVYFIAQTIASLLERELRSEMQKAELEKIQLLPEGRPTRTPTAAQVLNRFEHRAWHRLFDRGRLIKTFSDPLSPDQMMVLKLLKVSDAGFN
jgi:transposase